jgi:hypothetical protein
VDWYHFDQKRSERALQTELLAPALRNSDVRWHLLKGLDGFSHEESDTARPMHFVWVLRDMFYFEREAARKDRSWPALAKRWSMILGLPSWANDLAYWRHPDGYADDPDYIVHPTQKRLGWTKEGLALRYSQMSPSTPIEESTPVLTRARRFLNTECDCFIQTDRRLIVIECKDKTNFNSEQRERQRGLFKCLDRLLPRPEKLSYVEVAASHSDSPADLVLTWDDISAALGRA